MATYAIGDVQGCFEELLALLEVIHFDRDADRLWFVGDLVNRGPGSLDVLRFVRSLGPKSVAVLGNHDLHLLSLASGGARRREEDTLDGVLAAPDRDELLDWLRRRPLIHIEERRVLVHAGLLPTWSISQAMSLAAEVEAELRGPAYGMFLNQVRGVTGDEWRDDLGGLERFRTILNAMTRMRCCTPGGRIDLQGPGDSPNAPPGYWRWFETPGRRSADHQLICGHWAALGLHRSSNVVLLDSGCVWGGQLTAARLDDGTLIQVPCSQRSRVAQR